MIGLAELVVLVILVQAAIRRMPQIVGLVFMEEVEVTVVMDMGQRQLLMIGQVD